MDTNPPGLSIAGSPGWADAGVVLPHTIYRHYGEIDQIEVHWSSMERWMASGGVASTSTTVIGYRLMQLRCWTKQRRNC